jgi:hypothetical protein
MTKDLAAHMAKNWQQQILPEEKLILDFFFSDASSGEYKKSAIKNGLKEYLLKQDFRGIDVEKTIKKIGTPTSFANYLKKLCGFGFIKHTDKLNMTTYSKNNDVLFEKFYEYHNYLKEAQGEKDLKDGMSKLRGRIKGNGKKTEGGEKNESK